MAILILWLRCFVYQFNNLAVYFLLSAITSKFIIYLMQENHCLLIILMVLMHNNLTLYCLLVLHNAKSEALWIRLTLCWNLISITFFLLPWNGFKPEFSTWFAYHPILTCLYMECVHSFFVVYSFFLKNLFFCSHLCWIREIFNISTKFVFHISFFWNCIGTIECNNER